MATQRVTMEKVGISRKLFFNLFVFHELAKKPQHASMLYETLQSRFSMVPFSRTHFFKTVREMEQTGLICIIDSSKGLRKVYDMTQTGSQKAQDYHNHFYDDFTIIQRISSQLVDWMTREGAQPKAVPLSKAQQKFFSRLINTKELVEYVVIRYLQEHGRTHGSFIRQVMKETIGWQSSEGYFYDILHAMEEKTYIQGEWEGARRTTRGYIVTPEGLFALRIIEDNTLYAVRNVRNLMQTILAVL
jgi:DNA-binding PadR family transcriptional regulator